LLKCSLKEKSRYHEEFKEMNVIGIGGFGKVYKAQHRLDGINYAVKKIKFYPRDVISQYLNEIRTWAKLNHPNIVSYKAAWVEPRSKPVSAKAPSKGTIPANSKVVCPYKSDSVGMKFDQAVRDVAKSDSNTADNDENDNETSSENGT